MNYMELSILALAAALFVGCDPEKSLIFEMNEDTREAFATRKGQVEAAAKQADTNAQINRVRIEANKVSMQAQPDADGKKADAEAETAGLDAENE